MKKRLIVATVMFIILFIFSSYNSVYATMGEIDKRKEADKNIIEKNKEKEKNLLEKKEDLANFKKKKEKEKKLLEKKEDLANFEKKKEKENTQKNGGSLINNILSQGNNFFNPNNTSNNNDIGVKLKEQLDEMGIVPLVQSIGNIVFIIITSVLGVKYILAPSIEKADIKNSLITLCIGAIFFYLASDVFSFSKNVINSALGSANDISSIENRIWSTFKVVINICAIFSIIVIGLKYMLSPADSKGEVKKRAIPIIIGITMVYCGTNVLSFVINIAKSLMT